MKILSAIFTAFLLVGAWGQCASAEQPLVQEGKKTVFQRVVSHPGAVLYADAAASQKASEPRTFTAFYVYERKNGMLRVGVSSTKSDGWIKEDEIVEWPQAITMVFTDQMGRDPVMFFKNKDSLVELCNSDGISGKVAGYLRDFEQKGAPAGANNPVLATEPLPKEGKVSQKSFYLLPVLNMDDEFSEGGTQLIEVACIDPGNGPVKKAEPEKPALQVKNGDMQTGIVFLIDTTKSMGPYIDQTRKVIKTIFDRLQSSPARDNVAVAVVAFRSNVNERPDTEYNTKIISDFVKVDQRDELENLLNGLEECQASTHAFDEDSLSGVKEAVDSLSWNKINSRAIMLITDAGPLDGSDPTSGTGMSPEGMADYLRANNIYLTAAHVRSPGGKKDHKYAEKSYKALSRLSNNRSSYIPISAPDAKTGAAAFDRVAQTMADAYCAMAERQMKGQLAAKPKTNDVPRNASPEEQAKHMAEAIGYAMQLQFAGDSKDTRAPQVVRAWMADADLSALEKDPQAAPVPVVYPAVLLTKTQLSQLRKQLKNIISTAEEAFLQDSANFNFYEQLISAAAQMSRDPTSFNNDPNANLAQKGVLLEVLDGLPYHSQIMRLKQEDWTNMSTGEQQEFIKRLKGLLRSYEEYDRDNQRWEGFGSKNTNEWVYRVPLKMLP